MARLKPKRLQPFPISEFSGRQIGLVSKDTGDGGSGPISSPIWQPPPPLHPPLGLLPAPRRARSREFPAPATRRWGGGSCNVFQRPVTSDPHRTRDPRPQGRLHACAIV